MTIGLLTASYITSSVLFILALGGLSNQEKAKRAVWYGIVGMVIAVFATIYGNQVFATKWLNWLIAAILIGFIPGCGPQIMITSMYVSGQIPLSAQIGNAISNDGDALFPAIALAPKAAIIATLYSGIPAMIVAYSYMFLFE